MRVIPFSNADILERRARALRARHLPLAYGEVAELPRRHRLLHTVGSALVILLWIALVIVVGAMIDTVLRP